MLVSEIQQIRSTSQLHPSQLNKVGGGERRHRAKHKRADDAVAKGFLLLWLRQAEHLKVIKRLVDDGGINLAGVQRLLSIAEIVQRIRPLMRDDMLSARDGRRRLGQELDELLRTLGVD